MIHSGRSGAQKGFMRGAPLVGALCLALCLALVGCNLPGAASVPVIQTTPTPTSAPITPIPAATTYTTYTNTLYHYSAGYPSNWIAPSSNPALANFIIANYDPAIYTPSVVEPPFFKIEIDAVANPSYTAPLVIFHTAVSGPGAPKATILVSEQTFLAGWYATKVVWTTTAAPIPTITYLVQVGQFLLFIYQTNAVKGYPSPVFTQFLQSLAIY